MSLSTVCQYTDVRDSDIDISKPHGLAKATEAEAPKGPRLWEALSKRGRS